MKNTLPPLSERLFSALGYIENGDTVADIGTDHAYLPIYLVKTGICNKTYACDINEGPCERAKENIIRYSVPIGSVLVSKRNGIEGLSGLGINKYVICGMGGELICSILGGEEVSVGTRFILNPMTKQEILRKYLCENSYKILDENLVRSDGKIYQMIYAEKTDAPVPLPDRLALRFGKFNLERKTPLMAEYLEKTLGELKTAQNGRMLAGIASPDDDLIVEIEKIL